MRNEAQAVGASGAPSLESVGAQLRRERELRQLSLEELAQTTRIPIRMLQHLEESRFDALPGEVFTKGFIKSYARALGIDEEPLVECYGRECRKSEPPAPITAITPPERGRRFGIAIALVILLILFTLALSIVLRPRHRDTPIELSWNAPCLLRLPAPTHSSSVPSTTGSPIASSRS